ncbi:MAG: metallophosphoesterase family protein [Candidatus Aminicenantes bacterium]|nr:MAG: metallophosphoesterase family protein [Candidatus Aminicenantes bacterium]
MKKIIWLSDIHLNLLPKNGIATFVEIIKKRPSDTIWISGDIAEADSVVDFLSTMESEFEQPINFVLGNHDYYLGFFNEVRFKIRKLCSESGRLCWLNDSDVVEVTKEVGLIGHDSWADGRFGDYKNSDLLLNDYFMIWDFNPFVKKDVSGKQSFPGGIKNILSHFTSTQAKQSRLLKMQALAAEAVQHIEMHLCDSLKKYKKVFFLTHVPPFREACWHQDKISDDNGLPHFSCKIVGDTLIRIMKQYPDRHLTVLCGHTHCRAEAQILDNLKVFAAHAEYGIPEIQKIFKL